MAARKKTGLAVGQLLTLTFGFLLASVIIFVFGIWVGRDLSRDRERDDRPVVVRPVDKEGSATAVPANPRAVREPVFDEQPDARPTRPRLVPTSAGKSTRPAAPTRTTKPTRPPASTRTSTKRPAATATARRVKPTIAAAPAEKAIWTVQATATNDQVQAVIGARTLRSKGYEAFTVQADIGGTTWYRIQVGKFADKKEADKVAARLRRDGMEAAFVDRLR